MKKNEELLQALKIIWYISIFFSFGILFFSFLIPKNWFFHYIPLCEMKKIGKECILCGSTRAFLEIGKFNFEKAYVLNPLSIFILMVVVMNIFIFVIVKFKNLKK